MRHGVAKRTPVRFQASARQNLARCACAAADEGSETVNKTLGNFYERYLRRRPKQERSESVIRAALEATLDLLKRGEDDEGVTVRRVAERAGIGAGSFYDYFRDRQSLMRSAVAKLTEDNLIAFQDLLAKHAADPLDVAVRAMVDDAFQRYLSEPTLARAVLRLAHRFDLMPLLAESQATIGRAIGDALAKRSDVRIKDPDAAGYVAVQCTMGMVGARLWEENPAIDTTRVREELVRTLVAALRGGTAAA
jgi:AcrR family transcriptional regulator